MASQRVAIPFTFYYPSGSSPQLYASTSAGSYTSGTAINTLEPVVNTSVTVTDRNTLAPATIYQAETGAALFASLSTNASGGVSGWVDPGSYKIVAAALGAFVQTTINFEAVRGDGVTLIATNAVTNPTIAPNAVDSGKLSSSVQQALIPVGTILDYAGAVAPPGFLIANGQIVSTTGIYSNLASVLGNTWNTGGEGVGNVRLPNLQQSVAIGAVNSTAVNAGSAVVGSGSSTATSLAQKGGQLDHNHTVPIIGTTVNIPQLTVPGVNIHVNDHTHNLDGNGGAQIRANGAYYGSNALFILAAGNGPNFYEHGWAAYSNGYQGSSSNNGTGNNTPQASVPLIGTTSFSYGSGGIGGGGVAGYSDPALSNQYNNVGGQTTSQPLTTGAVNQQYVTVNKIIKY